MVPDMGPGGRGPTRMRRDNRKLYAELRRGLHRREFALHYQPQVALLRDCSAAPTLGAIRCWEALLRWPGRPEGPLPPDAYVGAAERSDVANEIGGWALTQACVEVRHQVGARVCVNVAGRQLFSGVLVRQVEAALALSGVAPGRLEIEISERVPLLVAPEAIAILAELRRLGLGIVLDDVGPTSAALHSLDRLPLTAIKLDAALIHALPLDDAARAVGVALVEAGHRLGLTVVAENVETEAHLQGAAQLGCDYAQGFLIAPPSPPHRIWDDVRRAEGACPAPSTAPGTQDDRTEPHRSRDPCAYAGTWS